MRLKIISLLLLCLIASITSFAQKQNVYFLKNNGTYVDSKDSADYIRIISEPDSGTVLYNLREFYKSGKPKMIGKTSRIDPPTFAGPYVGYFPSGRRKELATYKIGGEKVGDDFLYYPNGKIYLAVKYIDRKNNDADDFTNYTIMACNDSTGKPQVVDGNGYYTGFDDNFKYIAEEGNVKAGLRDGNWKGQEIYKTAKLTFAEKYDNGKLLTGTTTDSAGHQYTYTRQYVRPQYAHGEEALYDYLGNNIKYPEQDRRNNIQGKVILSFVVEKDGSITDIKVLKTPSEDLAQEAVRVVKKMPRWKPGMQHGRVVRVGYTLPVNFALGDQ